MAAGEKISNSVAAAVQAPEVDHKPGRAIALGHKPSWGTPGTRFVPAPDNSLFKQPFNELLGCFFYACRSFGSCVPTDLLGPQADADLNGG